MSFSQYTTRHLRAYLGIILLILISFSPVWAIEKPTKSQLESYAKDGSLNWRIGNALSFENHLVSPELVRSFGRQIDRIRLAQSGKIDTEIDRIPASVSASPVPLKSKGTDKAFALLISFPDYPANQTSESIASKLFGDGEGNWPYESLRNYYRRSSYNTLDIEGNVLGWYTPSYTRAGMPQTPEARESLIKEALLYYRNQGHDFSQYDNDGDGSIDYFMVIWTGPDDGWGGFWWGYQTSISDRYLSFSGKGLSQTRYSWLRDSGPDTLAFDPKAAIHETGHALGLPDYYDYVDQAGLRGGIGSLDMMDGERGDHNPFSKMLLGWIDPQVFDLGKGEFILSASGNSQDALLIVPDSTSAKTLHEFYLVQNRFRTENDFYLPGDGLLIWHVDAQVAGDGHFLNNNSLTDRKLLSLMEGDNKGHLQKGYPADSTDYFVKGKSIKLNLDPSPSAATPDISIYGIGPSGPVQFFSVDIQNPFSLQRSPMIQSSGSGNINSKVNVGNHASGSGTTYYVDAINGSDANNGLAPEKAWKTINKVNNSIYMPGDSILFKRGETWREQLTVPTSGSAGNPITFGAYGTGTKPIFNGAEIITTWTDSGVVTENTWKAILTTQPYAVWFDNTLGQKQESLAACRSARDWYWASNVIYVYPTTDADTAYSSPGIEASARSTLYMTDKNYVTIENIEFTKGGNALVDDVSVKFRQSKNIVIQDCDITKSVNIGLDIYKVDGTTGDTLVQRCSFSDTGLAKGSAGANSAIQTYNTGDDPTFTVQYCTFRNIDNFGAHHGHGIYHLSGKLIWRYNFHYGDNGGFLNTGAAVRLASTGGAQIYYNIFSDIGGKRYWGICGGEGTNLIYNNIFYNNHYAIYSGGRGTESFVVKNNIFCCSTTGVHIQHIEFTGKVKSYSGTNNLFYNIDGFDIFSWAGVEKATLALWKIASHQDENALNVDPKFISTSILDFHLLPASPCIYAGADVGLTQDYEGNSIRGLPDIGAFEFSDGTSSLIASAKGSPTTGQAPLTVNFTGKATGGTSPYSYSWNFGDGQSSSLQNPSHIFSSAGTYKVVLKVTDSRNATDTESLTIVVTSSGDTALELQLLIKSSVSS